MRDDTKAKFEHWADATFSRVGIWLYIATQGRLSRVLAHRRTLLLRTRGRRTGKKRTVVLQYFPTAMTCSSSPPMPAYHATRTGTTTCSLILIPASLSRGAECT